MGYNCPPRASVTTAPKPFRGDSTCRSHPGKAGPTPQVHTRCNPVFISDPRSRRGPLPFDADPDAWATAAVTTSVAAAADKCDHEPVDPERVEFETYTLTTTVARD